MCEWLIYDCPCSTVAEKKCRTLEKIMSGSFKSNAWSLKCMYCLFSIIVLTTYK